jgi:hypothetical protein
MTELPKTAKSRFCIRGQTLKLCKLVQNNAENINAKANKPATSSQRVFDKPSNQALLFSLGATNTKTTATKASNAGSKK